MSANVIGVHHHSTVGELKDFQKLISFARPVNNPWDDDDSIKFYKMDFRVSRSYFATLNSLLRMGFRSKQSVERVGRDCGSGGGGGA